MVARRQVTRQRQLGPLAALLLPVLACATLACGSGTETDSTSSNGGANAGGANAGGANAGGANAGGQDPVCEAGTVMVVPCGLNDRGEQTRVCDAGEWIDAGTCDDPDVCVDGDMDSL